MSPMDWAMTVVAGWVIVSLMIAGGLARARRPRDVGADVDQVVASEVETLDDEWARADREDMTWLWPK